MPRFDTSTLFRVTLAVASAMLFLRATYFGSPRDWVIAAVIYCGVMLVFACIGYRRNAKKAMMAQEKEPEKPPE